MGVLLDALRSVEFLCGAGDAVVTRFMVLGRSADYLKGHVFWRAESPPQMVFVPVTGEAKTSTRNAGGREFIDRFLGSGDCLGLASALDGLPHATDAEVTRGGEFFALSRPVLLRFLADHPDAQVKATATIGGLYRRAMKERENVALHPVPQRIAEFLLRHGCTREANGARVLVHANQAEIAARLGTVREVVSRVFTDFRQRGLIGRDGDGILIPDWDGLDAEAVADAGFGERTPVVIGAHEARTRRYFLPMAERRRRHEPVEDAALCFERLGDLSLCCARGCPVALEARASRPVAPRPPRVLARAPVPAADATAVASVRRRVVIAAS